ncbi:MAG: filamentous hemagglutinin N-terminal domain-containing protein [Pseudomonadota bacterium]
MRNQLDRNMSKPVVDNARRQLNCARPRVPVRSKVAQCLTSMSLAASLGVSVYAISGISAEVLAAPSGAQVVHGEASFNQSGSHLEITNSNGTIINWQDFSIASQESVNFLQTHASSAILNRVISNIPSDILGELTSNGRVFVINPNGLIIGKDARIDTAGFVASTLDIQDNDFIAGRMKFVGDSGEIENHGYIAAGPGGEVVLIAPDIENHGVIEADDGNILLAAGREVVLHSMQSGGLSYKVSAPGDRALNIGQLLAQNGSVKVFADQIFQRGSISANRARRSADGSIVLEADTTLDVSGQLAARGEQVEGGDIHLLGQQVDVHQADIDASGEGGGEVLIGGDYQGKGTVRNAENTNTDAATVIRADGGTNGAGGRVIVWSDDTTNSFAKITARGGSVSGDGGFVETSGKRVLDFGQPADVSATNGLAGTWLLDPEDIVIDEEHAASISTSLNGGSNVEVRTSDEGEGEGNITVDAPITKTEGDTAVSLTLDAHNRVDVNAPITTTAGPLNVNIKTGREVADAVADNDANLETDNPADDPADEENSLNADTGESQQEAEEDQNADSVAVENTDAEDGAGNSDEQGAGGDEGSESNESIAAEESTDAEENIASEESAAGDETADATDTEQSDQEAEVSAAGDITENDEPTADPDPADADDADAVASDDVSTDEMSEAAAEESTETDVPTEGQDEVANDVAEDQSQADATESDEAAESIAAEVVTQAAEQSSDQADDAESVDVGEAETRAAAAQNDTQAAGFIDTGSNQIVIADNIFTGGGQLSVSAGENGDTIISADINSADHAGQTAGDITIEGDRIAIVDDAAIDASAEEAGEILIGGGQQGQNEEVENSSVVIIGENASVSANGGEQGDGGTIIVFSENASVVSGDLSARGGTQSGDGGFIETSGLRNLSVSGTPDVGANNGEGGSWLIDPYTVYVSNTEASSYIEPPPGGMSDWLAVPSGFGSPVIISTDQLTNALNNGNVIIDTTNPAPTDGGGVGMEAGDVIWNGDLLLNDSFVSGSLTVNADRDINMTGTIQADGYLLDVLFNADRDVILGSTADISTGGRLHLNAQGNVDSQANVDVAGDIEIDAVTGFVDIREVDVTDVFRAGTSIQVDAAQTVSSDISLNAVNGNIVINSGVGQAPGSPGYDVTVRNRLQANGGIDITATRDLINDDPFAYISADSADINLSARRDILLNGSIFNQDGDININANVGGGFTGYAPSGDGFGVVRIRNENYGQSIIAQSDFYGPEDYYGGNINIHGAGLLIESSGCAGMECSAEIRLSALDINLGNADMESSRISGDIIIRSDANPGGADEVSYYGGFIGIDADRNLNVASTADVTVEAGDSTFVEVVDDVPGLGNSGVSNVIILQGNSVSVDAQDVSLISGVGPASSVNVTAQNYYYVPDLGEGMDPGYYVGGDLVIRANTLLIDADKTIEYYNPGDMTTTVFQQSDDVSLVGYSLVDIDLQNDLEMRGRVDMSNGYFDNPFNTFSASINAFGDLTINVADTLEMRSAEISLQTVLDDFSGEFGAYNNVDTITVGNLVSTNGLIVFDRDQSSNTPYYAPGELVLNTTGVDSQIFGVDDLPGNEHDYALNLRSVTWQQDGVVEWLGGSIEMGPAELLFNPDMFNPSVARDSEMHNNGGAIFLVNSDSTTGSFNFDLADGGVGTFHNEGLLERESGAGTALLNLDVENAGGDLYASEGLLQISGGVTQAGGTTSLSGGDLRVDGTGPSGNNGFYSTGGYLLGGVSETSGITEGGTLHGNVTIQGTTVAPGFSPGELTINGNFDASAGGNTFEIEIDAETGEHDQLIILGDANITANNNVESTVTGDFYIDPNDPNPFNTSFTVISANNADNMGIELLPTNHDVNQPGVYASENLDASGDFNLMFGRAVDPPPPVDPPPMPPEPPVVTPDPTPPDPTPPDPTPMPPTPTPMPPVEPDVIVVIIDDEPVALPPDIVEVLVSLSDEERNAYLHSERVREVLKKVNMCIGKV